MAVVLVTVAWKQPSNTGAMLDVTQNSPSQVSVAIGVGGGDPDPGEGGVVSNAMETGVGERSVSVIDSVGDIDEAGAGLADGTMPREAADGASVIPSGVGKAETGKIGITVVGTIPVATGWGEAAPGAAEEVVTGVPGIVVDSNVGSSGAVLARGEGEDSMVIASKVGEVAEVIEVDEQPQEMENSSGLTSSCSPVVSVRPWHGGNI